MKEVLRTIGGGTDKKTGVKVSSQLIKKSERLDSNGNVIDPETKQIIKKNDDITQ